MPETITLEQVYDEIKKIEKNMVTKQEIENMMATIEVMGNPETMKQIVSSIEDMQKGRVSIVKSAKDLFDEL